MELTYDRYQIRINALREQIDLIIGELDDTVSESEERAMRNEIEMLEREMEEAVTDFRAFRDGEGNEACQA